MLKVPWRLRKTYKSLHIVSRMLLEYSMSAHIHLTEGSPTSAKQATKDSSDKYKALIYFRLSLQLIYLLYIVSLQSDKLTK